MDNLFAKLPPPDSPANLRIALYRLHSVDWSNPIRPASGWPFITTQRRCRNEWPACPWAQKPIAATQHPGGKQVIGRAGTGQAVYAVEARMPAHVVCAFSRLPTRCTMHHSILATAGPFPEGDQSPTRLSH